MVYMDICKLLKIGNSLSIIFLIPAGNNGIMEWWNVDGIYSSPFVIHSAPPEIYCGLPAINFALLEIYPGPPGIYPTPLEIYCGPPGIHSAPVMSVFRPMIIDFNLEGNKYNIKQKIKMVHRLHRLHRLTQIIKIKKIRVNSCNSWAKKQKRRKKT